MKENTEEMARSRYGKRVQNCVQLSSTWLKDTGVLGVNGVFVPDPSLQSRTIPHRFNPSPRGKDKLKGAPITYSGLCLLPHGISCCANARILLLL